MEKTLPYIPAYGNISKCLNGIIAAKTPTKFSQDFLDTVLKLSGAGARPVIKYLKNIGFLSESGTPTQIYKDFRNPDKRGAAAAKALRHGYESLFRQNEYAHELNEEKLKLLIVSVLECAENDQRVPTIAKSFKNVNEFADFNADMTSSDKPSQSETTIALDTDIDTVQTSSTAS